MIEFVASGSPRLVSRAIEDYATGQGNVSAIVVPWESEQARLSMAVTAVKSDGWAVEHINLGTITLTDLGNDFTRVAIVGHQSDHEDNQKLTSLFDRFSLQVQRQCEIRS
jgi:hypothetical protein